MHSIARFLIGVFVLSALVLHGCGGSNSNLNIKTKISPQNVRVPSHENVDEWYRYWDKKNFIVGVSEASDVVQDKALERASSAIARALIVGLGGRSFFSESQLNSAVGEAAARFHLERQSLRSDDQDSLQSVEGEEPLLSDSGKSRLGFYFLNISDVRSAYLGLAELGFDAARFALQDLTQPVGLSRLLRSVSQTWPVEWVEPNLVGFLKPNARGLDSGSGLGLAPEFKYNTSIVAVLKRIRADSAFSFVEKSKQSLPAVNVAILDTGVDSSHPELKDQMFVNPGDRADGLDNDGNCFVDDVHGIDATFECGRDTGVDPKPGHADLGGAGNACPRLRASDELSANCGHGSHVAGIVAAKHGGDLSTMGICPSCKILSIRVAERCLQPDTSKAEECVRPTSKIDPLTSYEVDGGISDTSQIRALTYLYNLRAPDNPSRLLVNVVNLSLGKYFASRTMSYIIRNLQRKNIVVVAAAGNDGTETPSYPAAYDSVVAVCATSEDYAQGAYGRAPFSNFGDWVDICAPGTDIVSTVPGKTSDGGGLFIDKSGTSQATPFVAGAIGYLLSFNGNSKSAAQIIEMIKSGADSESLYNAPYNRVPGTDERLYRACYTDTSFCDNLLGAGFLDLDGAIQAKRQSKTNFNFQTNQPGGCIVGSVAFVERAGGRISYALGSAPGLLLLGFFALNAWRMINQRKRRSR
ncbi:MAG: hypothetical protein RI953_199 [Pseudomonadota bacterium]|jgi:subtilisin family serine protease